MKKTNYFIGWKEMIRISFILAAFFISYMVFGQAPTNGLKLYYSFASAPGGVVPDLSGNGYNGTLNGATVGVSTDGKNALILGSGGTDYLDMGASVGGLVSTLTDFSISAFVYVDAATNLSANGNFVAVFSNSAAQGQTAPAANGYWFLQAKRSRYSITSSGWCCEEYAQDPVGDIAKGRWVHMAYTQSGMQGTMYIDGVQKGVTTTTLLPSSLGSTSFNFIGKPCFSGDVYLMNAMISDFRIYNRALTNAEVLQTAGYPAELITQWQNLSLGDLSAVKTDLTLPLTMGSQGVTVSWASSNTNYISTNGKVTRPAQFDATVKLTATLKLTVGPKTDSIAKDFTAKVVSTNPASELLAKWDFTSTNISVIHDTIKVKDSSPSGFVGTLKNVAKIRTIGTTTKYNVLDLGNSNGYFDMDTVIGKAVYSLGDYSIGAYFRIDSTYTALGTNGNFIWNFSNTDTVGRKLGGYIIGILKSEANKITSTDWNGEQGPIVNSTVPQGKWHHFAYVQNGTTGTLYLDGNVISTASVSLLPSIALPKVGKTGTNFNWIGRSCYSGDVYLRQTLVYGFELYGVPLSQGDLQQTLDVPGVIAKLNAAYAQNPNVLSPELTAEMNNLSLGDLSAVTSNITLPLKGTLDPLISISWSSSNPILVTAGGVVSRHDYLNTSAVLTATLSKNGQKVTKDFTVNVLANSGTGFASDLLLHYNFADNRVSGTNVTDAAEKHFTGALMRGASILTVGPADNRFKVLNLGTDSSYFDMGTECGKLIYGLNNYSISVYFLIDRNKTNFSSAGNFIYTFSNSNDANTDRNGYIFGRASVAIHCVSSQYWGSGNMATANASEPSKGMFHHFVFTQKDSVGTAYLDGKAVSTVAAFTNLPSTAVAKSGFTGTLYNWLGRSNYKGDAYLLKALIADFQVYKKALTSDDISAMQVETSNLNLAFIQDSVSELILEKNNLDLGSLTAVVSDITLPVNGTLDPSIVITWTSSNPSVINTTGVVNRPDFLDAKVVLTATLSKDGEMLTKTFTATVPANPGTGYASDLLLNYNFADNLVTGTTVTDAAEKRFSGTLKKGATVSTIGPAGNKHNVLNLGVDSSYFDMGIDCGKLLYALNDHSVSVYFLIDPTKTNFSGKGNIIYTFSNSDSSSVRKNGYIFGRATNAVHCVSSQYSGSGSMQTAAAPAEPSKGSFHHLVFTQNGSVGTTYLDGDTVSSVVSFTNLPSIALPKTGLNGTLYNWLGRSSYQGDAYLSKAMIADFKLYNKVLTGSDVKTMQTETASLTAAYNNKTSVEVAKAEDKLIIDNSVPGLIQIKNLTGNEKVAVFDLIGRSIAVKNKRAISVKSGIYIVKVDNKVAKVLVK